MGAFEFHRGVDFACFRCVVYIVASGLLARNIFMWSEAAQFLHAIQSEIHLYATCYELWIKAATVTVVCYVAFKDLRTFKINNLSLGVLLLLYVLYVTAVRSLFDVISDVLLCAVVFATLLWFYSKGAIGGGDVKLLPIACLWVGTHCAALFSALLLCFIVIHLAAVKIGWAAVQYRGAQWSIPYAPSICGAFVVTVLLGCF